jgi:hypothetical protein
MAVLAKTLGTNGIAKKAEALPPGVLQRGLRLVERQPELRHHRLRPRQSLGRATATEDDEIVGVVNNVSAESFAPSARAPVLQKAVHVDVGEQRAHDPALRRAAFDALARPTSAACLSCALRPALSATA